MTTPILMLATDDQIIREVAAGALMVDLPGAVLLRHDLYPRSDSLGGVVRRLVTDASGVVEDDSTDLGHACLSCAVREDLVPTLRRLIDTGRWDSVVLALPTTAAPQPVACELEAAIGAGELAARIASVVSVLDPSRLIDDLFGDELLSERDGGLGSGDRRSAGEALASQIDYADVVCCLGPPEQEAAAVLDQLVAPTATWHPSLHEISAVELMARSHDVEDARNRCDPVLVPAPPVPDSDQVWTLELISPRPLHPTRLMEQLELLGAGRLRGRGCFWLPTRPRQVGAWDGAGGQLSIGSAGCWGRRQPITRLLITGIDPDDRDRVHRAFNDVLLTDFEVRRMGEWVGRDDPFDPWLGEIDQKGAG